MDKAIPCDKAIVSENKKRKSMPVDYVVYDKDVCSMPLFVIENEKCFVPEKVELIGEWQRRVVLM